jgi:hypothetical protein
VRSVHCPHCGQASHLPDPWPHDSFRCAHCKATVALGGPPAALPPAHAPRQAGHTRSAFGTVFGGTLGCFAAVGFLILTGIALVIFIALRTTN